ncbi:N-methylhydantoinase B/oxoprolinase/acetone carboxylase alpha subunit [Tamaricihabitans halophyticus]|uniref:N-methylhydantoinase B/oxoprolinase/acetone carboxylase alpha subunit n=1 Tax=Tamaricihabitans halophyticus TaxID=1262583 RepID=A0A4R2QVA4_9PSEU|nr:hydantoinase B/oxoprolinase family protein [Tamaricihabitans halophyticus]TCP52999.1 N-methylhydantoinase B/oxoprolinase/acetone carboxylase alpha subunit [Tamaricihabitans halophyticus]
MSTAESSTEQFFTDLLNNQPVMYEPDQEINAEYRLRPRTEREDEALAAITDPADLAVGLSRVEAVLQSSIEMMQQISASAAAKWGDLIVGIYTREGDFAVATSSGVNMFSATTSSVPKFIARYWADEPTVGVAEGDVFYHNDANYGGTHNPDHTLLIPLFWQGEHIAWIGAIIHEGENGAAIDQGGFSVRATTKYGEGIRIPPMKIGENYIVRRDVVNLFQNQVRDPMLWLTDIRSKLASARAVERRLQDFMGERSPELLIATMRSVLETTEAEVRRRIAAWPDGVYRAAHFADNTLMEERLFKLSVELDKRGDKLTIRTKGSSPSIDRALNAQAHFTRAIVGNLFMNFMYGDLPRTAGFIAALDYELEPGSIVTAGPDQPSSLSLLTMFSLNSALHQAVTKAMYAVPGVAKPMAPWYPQVPTLQYGGLTQHMQVYANVSTEMNAAGGGALHDRDGEHAAGPIFAPVSDWGEMEGREAELPLLGLWRCIPADNHGFGKFRGGASVEWAYMLYGSQMFGMGITSMGGRFPVTGGMFGGYGGSCTPLIRIRPDGGVDAVRQWLVDGGKGLTYEGSSMVANQPIAGEYLVDHPMQPADPRVEGDIWIQRVGGGGGYGDPLERDPEAAMQDLRRGLISPAVASEVYQLVWDEERMEADIEATEAARARERQARLARGRSYDEFVEAWRVDSPPEHLGYLGSWDWEDDEG